MKKTALLAKLLIASLITTIQVTAQFKPASGNEEWKNIYRSTSEKVNDLVHTRLEVSFDYEKSYLYGKEWLTLKPHFYNTDTLRLDAKGMDIKKVGLFENGKVTDLLYNYDNASLYIRLNRSYKGGEPYTIFIDYTAKPNELKAEGSAAITDAKGLYFINPTGKEKNKPTQIWTQGETEASSAWFPTIDKPNQKTTSEIAMTVPGKYVTLSNGKLTGQKKNIDGTRTDTWKMSLPHSPYLFFMGVGDFAIVKDNYKGKEVSYYVEKDFEKVARKIFGLTPEMMTFYSTKLGVDYPWDKYAQMVGRDYVSGAMENTSATLHSEYLQQNARELVDRNKYEDYISHELFHQWFGDLVTAESWSNLTVNESLANYSETLWNEYKHGQDAGDEHNYKQMFDYLESRGENKSLVRFHYRDKEDMFDRVTYEKGGRILNMLRNFVGDDAFFKSLNLYLNTNKFKSAEAHNLRLAFEEVTGKDLNWFWNQWYYGSGHPQLSITYGFDELTKKASVIVNQTQSGEQVFTLPVAIDIYNNGIKTRQQVWVRNRIDTFSFSSSDKPDLINFDADKILLAQKLENKTLDEYIFQYNNAKKYVDRREAIDYAVDQKQKPQALAFLIKAINDPFYEIRERVLKNLHAKDVDAAALKRIEDISKNDAKRIVRATAIDVLAGTVDPAYTNLYIAGVKDSSYTVAGASLSALAQIDAPKALSLLPAIKKDVKGRLEAAILEVEVLAKTDADFEEMTNKFDKATLLQKTSLYKAYLNYLGNVSNSDNFKKGIDRIILFRNRLAPYNPTFKTEVNGLLENLKNKKQSSKLRAGSSTVLEEQIDYLEKKMK
ncbi:MAG: family peptidase [Segetibacter sp.]|nr:family peptidase [Segetibacter sp.]